MKLTLHIASIFAFIFLIASCKQEETKSEDLARTGPAISNEKTSEVLDRHFKAFLENDMEIMMADYADDAILILPDTTYTGKEQIKSSFINAFKMFPKEGSSLTMDKKTINNNIAYIIWHGKSPDWDVSFATDTFVIEDGKIQRQTFAAVMKPVAK